MVEGKEGAENENRVISRTLLTVALTFMSKTYTVFVSLVISIKNVSADSLSFCCRGRGLSVQPAWSGILNPPASASPSVGSPDFGYELHNLLSRLCVHFIDGEIWKFFLLCEMVATKKNWVIRR